MKNMRMAQKYILNADQTFLCFFLKKKLMYVYTCMVEEIIQTRLGSRPVQAPLAGCHIQSVAHWQRWLTANSKETPAEGLLCCLRHRVVPDSYTSFSTS